MAPAMGVTRHENILTAACEGVQALQPKAPPWGRTMPSINTAAILLSVTREGTAKITLHSRLARLFTKATSLSD